MKIALKTFALTIGLLLTISAFGYFFWYKPKFKSHSKANVFAFTEKKDKDNSETLLRLYQKSLQAKHYINAHGFDAEHCFLLDMRISSGKNRFFVYNLEKDSVEIAGLVTHGSGIGNNSETPTFSNTPNSYCTSLGKYKIGKSYYGKFGLAYKLFGLDKTTAKPLTALLCCMGTVVYPMKRLRPAQFV